MSIKRSEQSTGMYTSWKVQANGSKDMEAVFTQMAAAHNEHIRTWLDRCEGSANGILGCDDAPDVMKEDARSASHLCKSVRCHLSSPSSMNHLAFEAFQLGQVMERLGIRPFEEFVERGRQNLSDLADGRSQLTAESMAHYRQIRDAVAQFMQTHPGRSQNDAIERTSAEKRRDRQRGWSKRTIQRALRAT